MIRVGRFYGRRKPTLSLRIIHSESGEIIGESTADADTLADNFFSRCPLQASLVPGSSYELQITLERMDSPGNLGIFLFEDGSLPLGLEYKD